MASCWRTLLAYRNYLIIYLVPLLFLPLPLVINSKEANCAFVIILMAIFWCCEALPLAVTSLLPVLLFPMMGIMDSTSVCAQYLKDTNMLFIGGLLVAIAVEQWNLHKRIALRLLLIVGVKPALLMLGFMLVTAFLSMWISNTATTAMMVPIAQAVLDQLYSSEKNVSAVLGTMELLTETRTEDAPANQVVLSAPNLQPQTEENHLKLCKGMSLCVCYSASIGGIATLTGTAPNLVLKGQMDELFPDNNNVINFASWFGFAFPTMIVLLVFSYLWLQIMFLGFNFQNNFGCGVSPEEKAKEKRAYEVIHREHSKLGAMSFAEIAVLTLFMLLVLLWFTREPGFMPGWATISFNRGEVRYVTDATVVIFISLMMFIFPSEVPTFTFGNSEDSDDKRTIRVTPALLSWKTVNDKLPWGIVLLLGGGFALAKGSEESGLSRWLGEKLTPLESIPPAAIALILCLLVATFTECTSNVATTTLFLPILASMAKAIHIHPLYIMVPCTLSASLAFMLPVATPPNAIVFGYGHLKVIDMAKTGFLLNILGVLIITLSINTWTFSMFNMGTFPTWANTTHSP
ncbi:solute carrier family 13 member 2-like [Pleurodeles waltl]|uniref:solute carrier family 13 member 2-like n=1 Tax=Pleurodeles waltl TaxID=8319 RepID=UPI0037098C5B